MILPEQIMNLILKDNNDALDTRKRSGMDILLNMFINIEIGCVMFTELFC